MFGENDIKFLQVQFEIPFLLQVKDSIEDGEGGYPVNIDDIPAELRFEKRSNESQGIHVAAQSHADRLGNVSRTLVLVCLGEEFIESMPDDLQGSPITDESLVFAMSSGMFNQNEEIRYVADSAVSYLNRYLDIYRAVTRSYWLRHLNKEEIVSFDFRAVDETGQEHNQSRKFTPRPVEGFSSTVDGETEERLRGMLANEARINTYQRMDFDTQDKIDLDEYDLAVANSYRLFEIWIKNTVEYVLSERGKSQSEIDDLLKDDDGDYVGLKNIVCNYLPDHLGFNFRDTTEFDDWEAKTDEIRHKVMHEGYQPRPQEAQKAYDASLKAMNRVSSEFDDELEGSNLRVRVEVERTRLQAKREGDSQSQE